jgi:phospholipase C
MPPTPRVSRRSPIPGTPNPNGIQGLLSTLNPNLNPANGAGATNPFRLDRSQAATADQDHDYTPEQAAFDKGLMDLFPANTGTAGPPPSGGGVVDTTGLVMGYYDGNTVTAMWNYAQYFALNDNAYGTNFGPSTVGAINLISGQTNGVINNVRGTGAVIADGTGGLTLIGDSDPNGDMCSTTSGENLNMSGQNIGNLLTNAGVSWGWFEGGFDLTITNPNGTTGCNRSTLSTVTGRLRKTTFLITRRSSTTPRRPTGRTRARPMSTRLARMVMRATTSTTLTTSLTPSTPATSRP